MKPATPQTEQTPLTQLRKVVFGGSRMTSSTEINEPRPRYKTASSYWKRAFFVLLVVFSSYAAFEMRVDQRIARRLSGRPTFPWRAPSTDAFSAMQAETRCQLEQLVPYETLSVSPYSRLESAVRIRGSKELLSEWANACLAFGVAHSFRARTNAADLGTLRAYANRIITDTGEWRERPRMVSQGLFGWVLLELHSQTGERRYRIAADHLAQFYLSQCPRSSTGTLPYRTRPGRTNICYVDSLGLVCPFLARYGREANCPAASNMAARQVVEFMERGIDGESGLPWHAYRSDGGVGYGLLGWTRGTGWLAVGLVGTLAELPADHRDHNVLAAGWCRLVDALRLRQQEDGLWTWALMIPRSNTDASGSAMIAWAIEQSISSGLLPRSYHSVADRALAGIFAETDQRGVLQGALCECQGVGHYPRLFGAYPWGQGFATAAAASHMALNATDR
jgi:rhamnogalacturonyl hydrolase YesR